MYVSKYTGKGCTYIEVTLVIVVVVVVKPCSKIVIEEVDVDDE